MPPTRAGAETSKPAVRLHKGRKRQRDSDEGLIMSEYVATQTAANAVLTAVTAKAHHGKVDMNSEATQCAGTLAGSA